jgi:hypothetical protein
MMRTRGLTLLLVLVIGSAVGYWLWPSGASGTSTRGAVPASSGRGGKTGQSDAVTDIHLDLLQRERGDLQPPDRNPFRFERRASAAAAAPPRSQVARQAAPAPVVPTEPLPPPPPPPIPLRFIGFLQPRDAAGRVAVLSDGRGNVFNGKEGDVIEGRYRLLRVGNDSADLIYLDGRGRQTIRLSGQ